MGYETYPVGGYGIYVNEEIMEGKIKCEDFDWDDFGYSMEIFINRESEFLKFIYYEDGNCESHSFVKIIDPINELNEGISEIKKLLKLDIEKKDIKFLLDLQYI